MKILENGLQFNGDLRKRPFTKRIVIHHSASGLNTTIQDIHRWHQQLNWSGVGYHYVIYPDGTIVRGRPEWAQGAHAYQDAQHDANSDGIGICLIGNFETGHPIDKQMASLAWLIQDIWIRFPGIPVIGHKDVMPTACPGRLFPWADLRRRLAKGVIDVALDKWMIDGGQAALKYLEQQGLVLNADDWGKEEKLAAPVPSYLMWMMIQRLAEKIKEGK